MLCKVKNESILNKTDGTERNVLQMRKTIVLNETKDISIVIHDKTEIVPWSI